jgi:hypothetical protein
MIKLVIADPSFVAARALVSAVGDEFELIRRRMPERHVMGSGVEFPARAVVWWWDCVLAVGARSGLGVARGLVNAAEE